MKQFAFFLVTCTVALGSLCAAYPVFASSRPSANDTTDLSNAAAVGWAPLGDELSFNSLGGLSRFFGGFFRFGVAAANSGGGGAEPVISSVATVTYVSNATTTWTTDEPATSDVVYGLTSSYGSATSSAVLSTSHTISITGLASSTIYHYAVVLLTASATPPPQATKLLRPHPTGYPWTPTALPSSLRPPAPAPVAQAPTPARVWSMFQAAWAMTQRVPRCSLGTLRCRAPRSRMGYLSFAPALLIGYS
jgi:hypothetical protein